MTQLNALRIDGSTGEGGGQVLRSVLTLSLLTTRSVEVVNIRARRAKPGLRPQHLRAVEAAAEIGQAKLRGAHLGSSRVVFEPTKVVPGRYAFEIGTAGATALVLQTIYLPLAKAASPSSVQITGGTHVPLSPCFHYLDLQWARTLRTIGLELELKMERAGFYPPGGGIVHASIHPTEHVRPLQLAERGQLIRIEGVSAVANLTTRVAERQREQALKRLAGQGVSCDIHIDRLQAPSKGTMLLLLATFEHASACFFGLGALGKPAERVADEAVDALCEFLHTESTVDSFLADQLLLPLAIAEGSSLFSTSRVSRHLLTNAQVISKFLPVTFEISGALGEPGTVEICPTHTNSGLG